MQKRIRFISKIVLLGMILCEAHDRDEGRQQMGCAARVRGWEREVDEGVHGGASAESQVR